jgi:hypothetical protein
MIKLTILRANFEKSEKLFLTFNAFQKYINRGRSLQFDKYSYRINYTPKIESLMAKNYYAYFYTVFDTYITLNKTKPGEKRRKYAKKKTDSNLILLNTLERFEYNLSKRLELKKMSAVVLTPRFEANNKARFTIIIEGKQEHKCEVIFDKTKWTFEIGEVVSASPKMIIKIVEKVLFENTYPTRYYRKKHKVQEKTYEDNIE